MVPRKSWTKMSTILAKSPSWWTNRQEVKCMRSTKMQGKLVGPIQGDGMPISERKRLTVLLAEVGTRQLGKTYLQVRQYDGAIGVMVPIPIWSSSSSKGVPSSSLISTGRSYRLGSFRSLCGSGPWRCIACWKPSSRRCSCCCDCESVTLRHWRRPPGACALT